MIFIANFGISGEKGRGGVLAVGDDEHQGEHRSRDDGRVVKLHNLKMG